MNRLAASIVIACVGLGAAVAEEAKGGEAKKKQEPPASRTVVERWFPEVAAEIKPVTLRALRGGLDKAAAEPVPCAANWQERFRNEALVCARTADIEAAKQAFVDSFSFLGSPGIMWSGSRKGYRMPKFLDWSTHPGTTWAARVSVLDEAATPMIYIQDDGLLFITLKLN
jgi:hypothetical protein